MSLSLWKKYSQSRPTIQIQGTVLVRLQIIGLRAESVKSTEAYCHTNGKWEAIDVSERYLLPPPMSGSNYIDPASRAAVAGARILKDRIPQINLSTLGCVIGTRTANAFSVALHISTIEAKRRPSPIVFAHAGWNVPTAIVAGELGCQGLASTICGGEKSGSAAVRYALIALKTGRARTMVTGVVALEPLIQTDNPDPIYTSVCMMAGLKIGITNFENNEKSQSIPDLPKEVLLPPELNDFGNAVAALREEQP